MKIEDKSTWIARQYQETVSLRHLALLGKSLSWRARKAYPRRIWVRRRTTAVQQGQKNTADEFTLCAGDNFIPGEPEKWFAGDKNSNNPKKLKKIQKILKF
jgi:hypothetical protein